MVWQAANLCQQTSHKSHVNKRQFSAKWHPWWLLLQPKGVERNHRVVDQQLYTYLILKSDQSYNCSPCNGSCWWSEKSFLFSHRYVCHWSYYCTQNLSFYFGEMSLKPAPVRLVFKRVQRSKGSAAIHKAYHRSWVSLFLQQNPHWTLIVFRYVLTSRYSLQQTNTFCNH